MGGCAKKQRVSFAHHKSRCRVAGSIASQWSERISTGDTKDEETIGFDDTWAADGRERRLPVAFFVQPTFPRFLRGNANCHGHRGASGGVLRERSDRMCD
jgi:hypothetical protein